jgi:hypothetical protein
LWKRAFPKRNQLEFFRVKISHKFLRSELR